MIIGNPIVIGGGGGVASIFAYGNLLSIDTVTCVTGSTSISGTWTTKTIASVTVSGWLFSNITLTGTYTITATRGALSTTETVLVDTFTDYNVSTNIPNVPSTYQELSYVESTGTQYITVDGTNYWSTSGQHSTLTIGTSHYITPCYRKADGEVGGYDNITSTFYTNQGTGSFIIGGIVDSTFTSTYQQVEYLQNTSSSSYIDSGFALNSNSRVFVRTEYLLTSGSAIYGARTTGTTGRFLFQQIAGPKYRTGFGTAEQEISDTYTQPFIIDHNKNVVTVNDGTVYTYTLTDNTFSGTYNAAILGFCDKGTFTGAIAKLYYGRIYDNDTLIRIFVPCYRKSDSKPGLYDMVNGVFYTNQGSGTDFTVGGDIDV